MSEETYRQFFIDADTDNSGYLTVHELLAILRKNGYKGDDETLKGYFSTADHSDDDKICYDEFMAAMGCHNKKEHEAATMRAVFQEFDMDCSGTIDRKELHHVLKKLGSKISKQEVDRIIELADKDGSECLNYEEFAKEVFG